ncbi:MAG: translation elongation factor Ts [Defluviitoga tunisiensis]|jgi:elongation factor Ts|uniref:Elongation factor Ts n=1 Tax=Defluviitoga tunisiensis TaxID=1006576 RepID=A0A0C7NSB7_DEFTU|nr:translation elongation factor Ts [Defluviitoga tunisiensis]MDD3600191.1 translation elongation factor Ts [Defluviitoga tunisiensis]CEP78737.1 elongation factor Ts [Defluviitoga tunisiensis]HOB54653.1 translation elongation factor Ts [Defluviitoga tunisiensis]HPZ65804.1 translation elongation factor Ts [Defluviitoga tunisiensis]HQD42632.1 translation elongation factor Ts [Defluviitoga tunisiensis]
MEVSIEKIKILRSTTGAGMLDCKSALEEADGDVDKAVEILRKRGAIKAAKKADRATKEGIVYSYIHHNEKIGVLLLLGCETDFVARTDEFHELAKKICFQIASMNPQWISREEVPEEVINKEKEIYAEELKDSNKPENVREKIIENKLEKFFQEQCLLEQEYVFGEGEKIKDLITELVAKVGENITIAKFARFAVGE